MTANKSKRVSNAQFKPRVTPTVHSGRGWMDFLEGKPYPKEYDEWNEVAQRHYERGRLRAAGAHLIYRRIPKKEPGDIVERTNGLKLVPRGRKGRPIHPLRSSGHQLQ